MTSRTAITPAVLDLPALVRLVEGPGHGAVVAFLGLVRDHNVGRQVTHLVYEAYDALALKALDRIVQEARGALAVGADGHAPPHRPSRDRRGQRGHRRGVGASGGRLAANRYAIERIKQIVPIWKHEYFEGGDAWIEGATADPDDADAREHALRIACA